MAWWPRLAPVRSKRRRAPAAAAFGEAPAAPTAPPAAPSANVTPRSLGVIESRIETLERELAESESESEDAVAPTVLKRQRQKRPPADALEAPGDEPGIESLHCEVCGVSVTSAALMREHLRGKKHREAVRTQQAVSEGRFCETCKLVFTSAAQLKEHCNGKAHRLKAGAGGGGGGWRPPSGGNGASSTSWRT